MYYIGSIRDYLLSFFIYYINNIFKEKNNEI